LQLIQIKNHSLTKVSNSEMTSNWALADRVQLVKSTFLARMCEELKLARLGNALE